jgi:hypothetical protein
LRIEVLEIALFPSLTGRDKGRVVMECIHVDAKGRCSCPIHWALPMPDESGNYRLDKSSNYADSQCVASSLL